LRNILLPIEKLVTQKLITALCLQFHQQFLLILISHTNSTDYNMHVSFYTFIHTPLMNENIEFREWNIVDGVLSLITISGSSIPTADEIYSAVFEHIYSASVTLRDVDSLEKRFSFSRYPVSLNIILKSNNDNGSRIILAIQAKSENGDCESISWQQHADHIVIDNTWFPFTPGSQNDIQSILDSAGIKETGTIRLGQYLSLVKTENDLVHNKIEQINPDIAGTVAEEGPQHVNAELYPYQKKGWQWLRFMRQENIGGILADEMGLGKTLQIITLLANESRKDIFPSLIICPSTLLENWRREFAKFAPQLSTHIHQGPQRTGFPTELKKNDIIITSYDTLLRDSSLFGNIEWKVVICDEAQVIKNPETKRAIAVKKVPRLAGFAVTGTPVENSLTDLWSILDFAVPGFLGSRSSFVGNFGTGMNGAARLEKLISPLILRRKISEVAQDLPPRIIIPQVMELNPEEEDSYERVREETRMEFQTNPSLLVLTRLRMFCTHSFLLSDRPGEDPSFYSNKYIRLVEIAEEIVANGAKMLVFTSYNRMNDLIVEDFSSRFGIYSVSIDGRTPVNKRQKIIDEFSAVKGAAVLVLNPIAAGTGLNITAASHVIHYNLEWNPAKEDQASARVYRKGQDKPVTIHRLIYANTVDEVIDQRLDRKRQLAGTAIVGVQGDEDDYYDILKAISKSPKKTK
jgi:SNF2 family DNA or RNA helicase